MLIKKKPECLLTKQIKNANLKNKNTYPFWYEVATDGCVFCHDASINRYNRKQSKR